MITAMVMAGTGGPHTFLCNESWLLELRFDFSRDGKQAWLIA
jgi:hypothetical protein